MLAFTVVRAVASTSMKHTSVMLRTLSNEHNYNLCRRYKINLPGNAYYHGVNGRLITVMVICLNCGVGSAAEYLTVSDTGGINIFQKRRSKNAASA